MKSKNILLIIFCISLFLVLSGCKKIKNKYTVTWVNFDGEVLEIDSEVLEGETPEYNGQTPYRPNDEIYSYEFFGWSPALEVVSSDVTYEAFFLKEKIEPEVVFSHNSGFYDDEFKLVLSSKKDATIYYTLDSSEPTEESLIYNEPILINDASVNPNVYSVMENISSIDVYYPNELVDKCVVLKAIAIDTEGRRSEVVCKTFFVDFDSKEGYDNLPIISLVLNPSDLFDYESGIYVTGKIYDESEHEGYPETYPANYNQKGDEWEKEAFMTYFEGDKSLSFTQNIGVRIHGGWSRAFNQKSFNLYARNKYDGNKAFKKSFFGNDNLKTCMLRSGGYRDTTLTKVRDSMNNDLSNNESFSIQDSFPCILFLNGEYWGIYNFQERFTEHYIEDHFGVDKDNVVIVRQNQVDEGNPEDILLYEEMVNFFKDNDFKDNSTYELSKKYIDVNEFAAYVSTELYIGNADWPKNNVRLWRSRTTSNKKYEDGVWRFMMYDSDDCANILSYKVSADSDPFINKTHWGDGPLDENCLVGLVMTRLLENDNFKLLFIETFKRIAEENFSSDKVSLYLKEKEELLSSPMALYYKRFVSSNTLKYNEIYFQNQLAIINEFYEQRYDYAIKYLYEHMAEYGGDI